MCSEKVEELALIGGRNQCDSVAQSLCNGRGLDVGEEAVPGPLQVRLLSLVTYEIKC